MLQNFFGEFLMNSQEFRYLRKKLKKSQQQMAELLAISHKAIQSYEQNWRKIPVHIERQLLFLVSRLNQKEIEPCWSIKKCSSKQKKKCPAWEFQAGKFCWLINGTICEGEVKKNWSEKIKSCRICEVFNSFFDLPKNFLKPKVPISPTKI